MVGLCEGGNEPPDSLKAIITMELWSRAQRAYAVKAFYKNGDSYMIAQREFRREFGIHCNHAVPSSYAIKTWFESDSICVIAAFAIIGLYFFEDERERAVSVTGQRYVDMLENFLAPGLARLPVNEDMFFQQDRATSHTA
ncbi:hypothetical protein ANN_17788 [Periplaneta americana]|uniref:DUF4817 domain-containing protein n=1 Tax=Periplaneta americana TaxID=6978 RepID=A0ABQ8SUV8_PERAM|nr:hypothetical protein ANN_17788 [Periplaneta americana]